MGDCFSNYPFLDHSYDADAKYQKVCQQLCAHNMWIRSVLIFQPKHKINDVLFDKLIVTCGDDENIKFWNAADGSNILKTRLGFSMNCMEELNFKEHGIDKQFFVIGGESGKLVIYDYSANTIVKDITRSIRNVLSIKVLPNKRDATSKYSTIITSNSKGEVRFWDWNRGVCTYKIYLGIQPIQGLSLLQDSQSNRRLPVLSNSYENKVVLWNVGAKAPKMLRQFLQHDNWVRSVVSRTVENIEGRFGKAKWINMLVTAGDDNIIRLFNMLSGECLREIKVHVSGIIYMEILDNLLVSVESCGRIGVTKLENMKTYSIATGLVVDYYKGFSLGYDERSKETYLGVVGSSPKKSSYHFLNIYRGKMIEHNIVFDIPEKPLPVNL